MARVGDMPFCPACGLDLEHLDGYPGSARPEPRQGSTQMADSAAPPGPPPGPSGPPGASPGPAAEPSRIPGEERPIVRPATGTTFASDLPRPVLAGLAILALFALAWVLTSGRLFGLGGGPTPTPTSAFGSTLPPGVTPAPGATLPPGEPSAPQVGLTILSPTDRSAVASRQVTVIGRAPAGVRVVQDISFGIDRSATADGTGHWAIVVDLREGANELTFRIGDDRSTEVKLLVSYRPQPTP